VGKKMKIIVSIPEDQKYWTPVLKALSINTWDTNDSFLRRILEFTLVVGYSVVTDPGDRLVSPGTGIIEQKINSLDLDCCEWTYESPSEEFGDIEVEITSSTYWFAPLLTVIVEKYCHNFDLLCGDDFGTLISVICELLRNNIKISIVSASLMKQIVILINESIKD
jgi:hypothetical protein